MVIYEVDIIFRCPCFVVDMFDARYPSHKQSYEFVDFIRRRHSKLLFDIDEFKDCTKNEVVH